MARERRGVFGEAAEQYEASRPDYPDALVDDVMHYAATVRRAVEIGAGTGCQRASKVATPVHQKQPHVVIAFSLPEERG